MDSFNLRLEGSRGPREGVHVRKLSAREAISDLYRFEIDLACDAARGLPEEFALGAEVRLVFEQNGETIRCVHGIVASLEADLETEGPWHGHRLVLVPRFHQFVLVQSPSIYVDARFEEVLAAELRAYELQPPTDGIVHDYELYIVNPTPRREFVVQYGESDFAFVSRRTEHFGISFFFEQTEDRERLVFTDSNARFRLCPGAESIPFNAKGTAARVYALRESKQLVPGFHHLTDYNERTPEKHVHGEHVLQGEGLAGGIVEQGANASTPDEANTIARLRAEECHARQLRYHGKSTLARLAPGTRTTITDHPRLGDSGELELLLVEVQHEATLPTPWDEATASSYRNEFVAIPASRPFRPARKTPRPQMAGVFTAVVQPLDPQGDATGPALDEHGRYRVKLHFDLESPRNPAASNWLRMAQPFEGGSHGMHFPLRPGTEVLVAFTNGDPDRPVILGALPNATAPSPVTARDSQFHRIQSPLGTVIEFGATRPGRS
jgi:type VI secretion system secreted protein VgrG